MSGVCCDEPVAVEAGVMFDPAEATFVVVPGTRVVLLGSIATGKYVDVLTRALGERLHFPADFVGRGDMSRGGLMLRSADSGSELEYVAFGADAVRHGSRPPKLPPLRSARRTA